MIGGLNKKVRGQRAQYCASFTCLRMEFTSSPLRNEQRFAVLLAELAIA